MRQRLIFRTWGKAYNGIEVHRRKLCSHPVPKIIGFQIYSCLHLIVVNGGKTKVGEKNEPQRDTRTYCDGSDYRDCLKSFGSFVAGNYKTRLVRLHYDFTIKGVAIAAPFFVISEV